jgi:hypothetical protein
LRQSELPFLERERGRLGHVPVLPWQARLTRHPHRLEKILSVSENSILYSEERKYSVST